MKILSHPLIEQTEDPMKGADGKPFSMEARIRGEHTLTELRELLEQQFLSSIQNDFRDGAYRLITLRPESVKVAEQCTDLMFSDAVRQNFSGKRFTAYVDGRAGKFYQGSLWHPHSSMTSSVCFEGGSMPTLFLHDEQEFISYLADHQENLPPRVQELLCEENPHPFKVAHTLWSDGSSERSLANLATFLADSKKDIVGTKAVFPELGNINVFSPGMIHAGGAHAIGEPGSLFVEEWTGRT